MLGVAAIGVPAREPGTDAEVLSAGPAPATDAAGVTEPRDPDPLAALEAPGARTQLVDDTHHLVAGHDR